MLEHWDAVPDAEQLVGESRAAVLVRCIAVLCSPPGQFEDCLDADRAASSAAQRDPVAVIYLRLRRHVVLEELARDDEDQAAVRVARDDGRRP